MELDLQAALQQHFGFPAFRPGQEQAVRHVLAGRDGLVVMPTGSGKSLIYQLAALCLPGTALVVSPLVALMKDQADSLARRRLPATYVNSSLDLPEQMRRLRGLAAGEYKLVLVAPERFRSPAFRQALSQAQLSLLAVDEAHCLSQWGHDFRPDYLYLAEARRQLQPSVTLALTATATPRVQDDILRLLGLEQAERTITGFNRPNLLFRVRPARTDAAKQRLLSEFVQAQAGAGLIYTGTRREAEEVAAFVRAELRRPAGHYHAALPADERARVQDAFLSGDLPLVAATNAFGMGIDRPDVRFVLHYTTPGTLEAYYQEAGRAGRDDLPAEVMLLYGARDAALHQHFIDTASPADADLRRLHAHVQQLEGLTDLEQLAAATGLKPTLLRVALDQLEAARALRREDEAYGRLRLEAAPLSRAALRQLEQENGARRRHKLDLLDRMLDYAQTGGCRRRALLHHFGDADPGEVPPEACCDNCAARAGASHIPARARAAAPPTPLPADLADLSRSERAALIALDAVRRQERPLGRGRLAQFLRGSNSEAVALLRGRPYFGKLADLRLADVEALLDQLLESGHLRLTGGLYPVLTLSPLGENALQNRAAIRVQLAEAQPEAARRRAAEAAGGTLKLTLDLQRRGLNPEQIAAERGLAESTIYSHLAQLIGQGEVPLEAVVPAETQARIVAAIQAVGSADYLSPIKARMADFTTYGEIRCVVEAWRRGNRDKDKDKDKDKDRDRDD